DPARASTFFRQGCDGGDDHACGALGRMLLDGDGVPKDQAKAAELLKRACDGTQAAACVDLGLMSETGNGAPKNPMIAKFLYEPACMRGDFVGCSNQGRLELGQGGNPDAAKRAFSQACDFKQIAVACAVNKILFNGNRPFVPSPAETNDLMSRCNGG